MSAPDLCAPTEAWRTWRVLATARGYRLSSVLYDDVWQPGAALQASCADRDARHDAPAAGCCCGIYGARLLAGAAAYLVGRNDPGVVLRVLGVVALWGDVFEGVDGWRARFAYPVELWVPQTRDATSVSNGLHAYGVAVHLLSGRRVAEVANELAAA